MTLNLQHVTQRFASAVEAAEMRWAQLKVDRENPRLMARYIRTLRRCDRLRTTLKTMVDKGTL